jgi:hypothetical protein
MKSQLIYIFFLIVSVFIIYPKVYDEKLNISGDNASYYVLAKSLAHGNGYSSGNEAYPKPANHFPPGYPAILSVFLRVNDGDIDYTNHISGLFLIGSVIVLFLLSIELTKSKIVSFFIALIFLFNPHILGYAVITMSEIPFIFLFLTSIYLFLLVVKRNRYFKDYLFYLFLLVLILTIYTRTIGIVLVGAISLQLILHKKWKPFLFLCVFTFCALLPWQIRSAKLGGSSYMKQIMKTNPYDPTSKEMHGTLWLDRFKVNAKRYISKEIPNSIFTSYEVVYKDVKGKDTKNTTIGYIIGFLILGLIFIGIWSEKEFKWFYLVLFTGILTVLFLWPEVWFGVRFLVPFIPLMILMFFKGLWHLKNLVLKTDFYLKISPFYSLVLGLVVLLQINSLEKLIEKVNSSYLPNWENYFMMAEYVDKNTNENAVTCTRKPELFYVSSGNKSVSFPSTKKEDEFIQFLVNKKVEYVIVENLGFKQTREYLVPFIQNNPDKFKQIHTVGTEVYEGKLGVWLFQFNPKKGYFGKYVNGMKSGNGKLLKIDNSIIYGNWNKNVLSGQGELHIPGKNIFKGNWKNGKKNGKFIVNDLIHKKNYEMYWINDSLSKEGWLLDENNHRQTKMKFN